ncbi:MAG: hypothetical protein QG673_2114 [Pseudomonadota bacterium]|nr:hypothetical protein [Pseudomonadota bacterium]
MKLTYNNIRKLFVLYPARHVELKNETIQLIEHLTELTQTEKFRVP